MPNKWKEIEKREGKPMREILITLYREHGHESQEEIAKRLGVSQPTLSQWIRCLGLRRKVTLIRSEGKGGDPIPEQS